MEKIKVVFYIFSIVIFLVSCNNSSIDYLTEDAKQPNCSDMTKGLETLNDDESEVPQDYTGIVFSCREGKVVYLGYYRNGRREGLYKAWHENGQLWYLLHWKLGKVVNLNRSWYKNGVLKYEKEFNSGIPDGFVKFWYSNGQLKEENYYIMGKPDGVQRAWFSNGQLKAELHYTNGKMLGEH